MLACYRFKRLKGDVGAGRGREVLGNDGMPFPLVVAVVKDDDDVHELLETRLSLDPKDQLTKTQKE